MKAEDLMPTSEAAKFLNYPNNERWTHLKPVITSLYMDCCDTSGKVMTYSKVATFMKLHYNFHAAESQYKRWFTEWGVRKRTYATEKGVIVSVLGKRQRPGQSTSNVTLQQGNSDKHIDKKQLARYLKSEIQTYKTCKIAPGVLSSWSLPYAAWTKTFESQPDQPSPFGTSEWTPNYMNIESPAAISPSQEFAAPSPTMQLLENERADYRSSMLLQGSLNALLTSLGRDNRMVVHNFFHDFYIHSFVTAKYWGKGPLAWSPEMITALISSEMSQPAQISSSSADSLVTTVTGTGSQSPTNLCRWAIHAEQHKYEPIPEVSNEDELFDIRNPNSWAEWPNQQLSSLSFTNSMQNSLENHAFSHTPVEDLPISMNMITSSVSQDPRCLVIDAWKLAIIAGNRDLLATLRYQIDHTALEDIKDIYPFHLAIAFLDGAKSCCGVFEDLAGTLIPWRHRVDNFGHTIFDSLMISILSSHTDLHPQEVSPAFREMTRFPGEEKDICGRWDTDSPIIRKLFEDGTARIPAQWKHPFCHTSVQAICHVLTILGTHIEVDSGGLFARYCSNCGLKLTLGPLHTLIIVAASLARNDGIYPHVLTKSDVSVEDLYGIAEPGRCYHKSMDAFEFIKTVPRGIIEQWSSECQVGWECMTQILRIAAEVESGEGDESDEEDMDLGPCRICRRYEGFCKEPKLGILWATIQTELLTYRRLDEGLPWISANFSMQALETFLKIDGEEFDTPLVKANMMKPHSECGWFEDRIMPIAEDVCNHFFMNMEDHSRSSFLPRQGVEFD
ncbi:unnamed protein product [Clonostachys rosea f. rosea IK726]|uniref:Clr5 domain-containing protein n=2 Tax=Bionectria ochroleuca TaxID=29856 RepID=A0A0B7KJ98_BIOOC|nr:unnamed protein product [Clonostachys rosea f. rosea IK726]